MILHFRQIEIILSFNRTIVELKHTNEDGSVTTKNAFNRTIVELKQDIRFRFPMTARPFNRTIVELKL